MGYYLKQVKICNCKGLSYAEGSTANKCWSKSKAIYFGREKKVSKKPGSM